MKLSCLQGNLSKGLGVVSRAVATRSTLPITQNILLTAEQSRLKLEATNLEMATTSWISAKVEEEGTITIPARLLIDFVNSLPDELIEINLPTDSHILKLESGRSKAHINGIDSNDFPPIPQINEGTTVKIGVGALRDAIVQVVFGAATEETRPALTGINAEFEGDKLVLAAADGFRLAVHTATLDTPVDEKITVIIPARTLSEVNRLLGDQEEPVEIIINKQKSQVLFHLKDADLVSQIIQGSFPDYSQVIPQSYDTRAILDIDQFQKATKMSSIFARDASGIIRLVVTPGPELKTGKVTISAQAEEVGGNVTEIDARVEGDTANIAFNVKYLNEVLAVIRQSEVALEVTTTSSPGVIRPLGVDNYVHVIMPMFVQW